MMDGGVTSSPKSAVRANRRSEHRNPRTPARRTPFGQDGKARSVKPLTEFGTKKAAPFGHRLKTCIYWWPLQASQPRSTGLAKGREAERTLAAAGARIFHILRLLRSARKLLNGVVAFANGGCELFTKPFRRLTEVVAALGGGFRKRRIGEMSAIANAGAIFFELDLALEIGGHLIKFANNSLEIVNLSGLLFHFPTLQANGHVT